LFSQAPGFVETRLFRDSSDDQRFLTLDRWRDEASWTEFLTQRGDSYSALDIRLESLTLQEKDVLEE
jgi:heme-degrading monooxygenase HmoA